MIDRIREIMEYAKMSQQDFAARLGISPASLSSILTGRTNPTSKHIMGIHQGFPEINVNWLMFGEGTMLTGEHAVEGNAEQFGAETDTLGQTDSDEVNNTPEALNLSETPSLFSNDSSTLPSTSSVEHKAAAYGTRRDQRATVRGNGNVITTAINIDKDERKIKEIRVFYNNGTYESFVPSNR